MLVSAELRWFWQGDCPADIARWFHDRAQFRNAPESRCDRYLRQPGRDEIGIKARGTKTGVEIKGRVGLCRDPVLAGLAPHFEIWAKWDADLAITDVIEIHKMRVSRAFDAEGPEAIEVPLRPEAQLAQGCHLELTKLAIGGRREIFWTLGLEALGDLSSASQKLCWLVKRLRADGLSVHDGAFMGYPAWLDSLAS